MDLNQQRVEIEQFLLDVREHIRSSLETSEYENTSNLFHVTEAQSSLQLLQKCEQLLARFADRNHNGGGKSCNGAATNGSDKHRFNNIHINNNINNNINRNKNKNNKNQKHSTIATTMQMPLRTSTMTTNKDTLAMTNGLGGSMNGPLELGLELERDDDVSYLDMTASKKISDSKEYIAFNNSTHSDKTFRCSTRNGGERRRGSLLGDGSTSGEDDDDDGDATNGNVNGNGNHHNIDGSSGDENRVDSFDEEDEDEEEAENENDPQIYDICHVTQVDPDETQTAAVASPDSTHLIAVDCPYMELPAGHLAIQRSTKYGQLQRIEKRLFFDQSKKCYCGILNDWLLCYADGPTSSRPNITLHLKSPGVEIEHSGEGKRREVCFQITTAADPSKRYVFQANNEVDAKEWIHAIEAAIRGDCAAVLKNARKLPTPPVMKRMTFVSGAGKGGEAANCSPDSIYEEPSPLYHVHEPTELLISSPAGANQKHNQNHKQNEKPPDLPDKQLSGHSISLAKQFEYDVPKCPPQPLLVRVTEPPTELETAGLLNHADEPHLLGTPTSGGGGGQSSSGRPSSRNSIDTLDFQTKVKDVHSKLSSQLSAGPSLKKPAKKSYSSGSSSNEAESVALTPSPTTKELKKQKKSNPNSSPSMSSSHKTASIGKANGGGSCGAASAEKSAKNWFLNRLNKTTSSTRSCGGGGGGSNSTIISPTRCKQSEKENLLSSLDFTDSFEGSDSNPTSPILKGGGVSTSGGGGGAKSKVNMIINQFESSGHLAMFSVEALAGNAAATFSSFCDSDCNNYEPIMTLSTPPSSFMKKV